MRKRMREECLIGTRLILKLIIRKAEELFGAEAVPLGLHLLAALDECEKLRMRERVAIP